MRAIVPALAIALAAFVHDARANAPAGHYTLTADTARDTKTGLTWQRGTAPTRISLADANTYCAGLSAGGMTSGWRVPNIRELLSTVDPSATTSPRWDQTTFGASGPGEVWTTTPVANDANGKIWAVSFVFGNTENVLPTVTLGARCVHD